MTLMGAHDHIENLKPPLCLKSMILIEMAHIEDRVAKLEHMVHEMEWEQADEKL